MSADPTKETSSKTQADRSALGNRMALGLLVCLAFGIRLTYAIQQHIAFGDEPCYVWLAQNLFGGHGYTYYAGTPELHFPPLFPISLGLLNYVVRDWEAVTRTAYVLFGSLIPLPIYLLGSAMYSKRAGLVSGLLAAVLPAFTSGFFFAETMSEPLFLLVAFSGLAFAYRAAVTKGLVSAAIAGAFLSLAILTRSEGEVYFLAGFGLIVLVSLFPRPASLRRRVMQLAVYTGAFLAVASPYVLYLHSHTGKWALDTKSTTSYTTTRALVTQDGIGFQRDMWGLNEKGEVHYYAHEFDQSLFELLRGKYRDRVFSDIRANFWTAKSTFLRPWVCGRHMLALALIGWIGAVLVRRRPSAEALHFLLIGAIAPVLIFFIRERFLYGLLLPVLLWAGCGLDLMALAAEGWAAKRPRAAQLAVSMILVALLGAASAYFAHQGYRHWKRKQLDQSEVLVAGDWLRTHTPPDAVLMVTGTEVAFHAGRRWLPVPAADHAQIIEYGRKRGATHLCLRGRYLERRPEQNAELFEGAKDFPDLTLLVKSGAGDSPEKFVVYAIKNAAPAR